jgi:hypothetical protein
MSHQCPATNLASVAPAWSSAYGLEGAGGGGGEHELEVRTQAGLRQNRLGGLRGGLRQHGELEAPFAQPRQRLRDVRVGGHRRQPLQRALGERRVAAGALEAPPQRGVQQRLELALTPGEDRHHRHHVGLVERGDPELRRIQENAGIDQRPVEVEDDPHGRHSVRR